MPPRIFVFTGLDGVGRRSVAEHAFRNFLSLALASPIIVDMSWGITDLFLRLQSEFSEAATLESLAKVKGIFETLPYEAQIQETARLLAKYNDYNLAPLLLDGGGAMEERGGYKGYLWEIRALAYKLFKVK